MPATTEETRRYMLIYYVGLSCIFWFDWFVTLHKEYRKIWKSKWNAVKIVYLVLRYSMLALTIFILQGFRMDWTTQRCNKYLLGWQNALPLIIQTGIGFMLMLRCYALWASSKVVLAFLMVLHAVHMGVSTWLSVSDVKTLVFPEGTGPCIPYNTRPNLMLGCILALVYDVAATGLTLYKALQVKSMMGKSMKSTIVVSIIRHGTVYFFGTSIVVCANMALLHLSRANQTPFRGYLGGNLCTVFNTILACRLALSLKKDAEARRKPIGESLTGYNSTALPMGGSESTAAPLSPGGRSFMSKGANTGSGWSGFRSMGSGTTIVNSPNNSGKYTLPAFPARGMTRKKVVLRKDEDDLDMYDSQKDIELDYMPEIEEGIEEEKRKSLREELEAEEEKRASDLYKALEGVQESERTNDLEKGVSEKQEMNEKRG